MHNPFAEIIQELAEIKQMIGAPAAASKTVEIIDRPELLKRLAITEPTCIRWEKKGKIPAIRIGSSVRYNWTTVVEQLEKNK